MSRETRLAKRDVKLKKLAEKRGLKNLPPQSKTMGDMLHTARLMRAMRLGSLGGEVSRMQEAALRAAAKTQDKK